MKSKKIWLVIVLVFGMMSGVYAQSGGTFTLTGIPARFDGMYAILGGNAGGLHLRGGESAIEGSRISDGRVVLPMWIGRERYTGHHTVEVIITIGRSSFIVTGQGIGGVFFGREYMWNELIHDSSVSFSNGSATRSWRDASEEW